MKHELRGWLGLCTMVVALRAVAVLMRAGRLGVGRPIIFKEVLVILKSLFLLVRESMVK